MLKVEGSVPPDARYVTVTLLGSFVVVDAPNDVMSVAVLETVVASPVPPGVVTLVCINGFGNLLNRYSIRLIIRVIRAVCNTVICLITIAAKIPDDHDDDEEFDDGETTCG